MKLYHVTLTLLSGEERIYTPWGKRAADELRKRLKETYPGGTVSKPEPQGPEVRQPVCS